jgi:tetratricopeptide (TPR) repeat protein
MAVKVYEPEKFVKWLRRQQGRKPVLFLGAGCSRTSGVEAAGGVVEKFVVPAIERNGGIEKALDDIGYTRGELEANPAALYGPLMAQLLKDERQKIILRACRGKMPGFGYSVLGRVMAPPHELFDRVLTTNFDDLVADACYVFGGRRPIVLHDQPRAYEPDAGDPYPQVFKLHGDYLFNARNTAKETGRVHPKVRSRVESIVRGRPLIFVGYGGHDVGIAKMFAGFGSTAPSGAVHWIAPDRPADEIHERWLAKRDTRWVACEFDELMAWIVKEFKPLDPERAPIQDEMRQRIDTTYRRLRDKVREENRPAERNPLRDLRQAKSAAWAVEWRVQHDKHTATNLWPALSVYEENLREFAMSPAIHTSYAYFLARVAGDLEGAEHHYRAAVDVANPRDPQEWSICVAAYADFLWRWKKEPPPAAEIEATFESGLTKSPSPIAHSDYAHYLESRARAADGQEKEELLRLAQGQHEAAVKAGARLKQAGGAHEDDAARYAYAFALSNFAYFLEQEKKIDQARELHDDAVLGDTGARWRHNRAMFRFRQNEPDAALEDLEAALEQDAHFSLALSDMASLLLSRLAPEDHTDLDQLNRIEDLFAAAVSADPMDALARSAYAGFLAKFQPAKARVMIEQCRAVALPQELDAMMAACHLWGWLGGDDRLRDQSARELAVILQSDSRPDLKSRDDFFWARVNFLVPAADRTDLQRRVIDAIYSGTGALSPADIKTLQDGGR